MLEYLLLLPVFALAGLTFLALAIALFGRSARD